MPMSAMGAAALGFAVVTAALSGCSHDFRDPRMMPTRELALTPTQFLAVQEAIKRELKDPTSPLFGVPAAGVDANGDTIVCGLVNAKNGFGGYAGPEPYLGTLRGGDRPIFTVISMSSSAAARSSLLTDCYTRNLIPKDVPTGSAPPGARAK